MLKAGISKVKITPPFGLEMAGYGIYLNRIGKEISSALEMSEDNITISTTHTHSGPTTVYLRGWGDMDKNYMVFLKEKIIESAKEANKNLEPVIIGAGQGKVEINFNRVVKGGPTDTALMVLRVDNLSGKTKAILYNYSAHAVVMGPDSFAVSADWPGYASAKLDSVLSGGMGMFLQGFCGDVNIKDNGSSSFDKAKEYGEILANEVLRVTKKIKLEKSKKIKMYSKIINLPLHIPDQKDIEDMLQHYAEHRKQANWERFFQEWKDDTIREINRNPRDVLPAEIQILAIDNDILFVMEPGEVFTKWGMKIKEISPFKNTFVIGYANDCIGYIPDKDDFVRKGYAAHMVPLILGFFHFKPNAGEILVEGVGELTTQDLTSPHSQFHT